MDNNMDGVIDIQSQYIWTYDSAGEKDSQYYQTDTTKEYETWLNTNSNPIPLRYYYEQNGVRETDFASYCLE